MDSAELEQHINRVASSLDLSSTSDRPTPSLIQRRSRESLGVSPDADITELTVTLASDLLNLMSGVRDALYPPTEDTAITANDEPSVWQPRN